MPKTPNVLLPLKKMLDELFSLYNLNVDACYLHLPDCESVDVWAKNVAEEITKWNPSEDIVIVGLNMGSKVAVHLTTYEQFGVQDRIDSVVTINSPLKSFDHYHNAFLDTITLHFYYHLWGRRL
jgi:predicted alpha/beta hydrolase family esterase